MWLSLALLFACGMLGGAVFSAPVYCFSSWFRQAKPSWSRALDVILALLGLPLFNLNLLFVLPVCLGGALAARSQERDSRSVLFHLTRMLSSTTLPFLLLGVAWLFLAPVFPTPYAALTTLSDAYLATDLSVISVWAGMLVGFAVVPASCACWNSPRLRRVAA